ncbi:hypothetical protein OTU49_012245, partial [Cherax quadricarinatus]
IYVPSLECARNTATPWTVSRSGRRVFRVLTLAGATSSFLIYYLPNTYFLRRYREVTQLYRKGFEVPVSDRVTSLVSEVMDDLGISKSERKLVSTYMCYGFEPFHAGTTMLMTGGILGVPVNFNYRTVDEFVQTNVTVNNNPVPWSTSEGISLKQSLSLSDDAKKFAIAREITSLSTAQPFLLGAVSAVVVGFVYSVSSTVNAKLNLYARPRSLRLVWYGLVSMFGLVFWTLCKDMSTVEYEINADKAVASISNKYAVGGLEYYEKVLQRNVALRALMGSDGEKVYTVYGNDQVLVRTKHLPFTLRRDYMKTQLEEYKKVKEDTPIPVSGDSEAVNTS